jgi:oligopeptide/dipeptide ABC transporter ATP-binding protein
MSELLNINNLTVQFETDDGPVTAVDRVCLSISKGQTLGLVGESGSGKSVTAMSTLRLIPCPPGQITGGTITHHGRDLLHLPINELRRIRGARISMIFQEPMTALSPLHRIGRQLVETLRFHRTISRKDAWQCALEWLRKVGIPAPEERINAYPHELSGGMRQRVMIAMALMLEPELIIADEPTTALDVTIQAQILELMSSMREPDTALWLITHDMGVIRELCTHVAVMYAGQIVETGTCNELFNNPLHPYTKALLTSIPSLEGKTDRLPVIKGQVPSPRDYPPGCRFAERCPRCFEPCRDFPPTQTDLYGRQVRCHLYDPAHRTH